jgi:hypothetical protein
MRHWWVNQNQTYEAEISGGYIWSPKRNQNGARNQFYENMREVARASDQTPLLVTFSMQGSVVSPFEKDIALPNHSASAQHLEKIIVGPKETPTDFAQRSTRRLCHFERHERLPAIACSLLAKSRRFRHAPAFLFPLGRQFSGGTTIFAANRALNSIKDLPRPRIAIAFLGLKGIFKIVHG